MILKFDSPKLPVPHMAKITNVSVLFTPYSVTIIFILLVRIYYLTIIKSSHILKKLFYLTNTRNCTKYFQLSRRLNDF